MTARCASYIWVPWKKFESPWVCPRLLFSKFLMGFCSDAPLNVPAKFEVRSFTLSWDNSDWSFGRGLRTGGHTWWILTSMVSLPLIHLLIHTRGHQYKLYIIRQCVPKLFVRTFLHAQHINTWNSSPTIQYVSTPLPALSIHWKMLTSWLEVLLVSCQLLNVCALCVEWVKLTIWGNKSHGIGVIFHWRPHDDDRNLSRCDTIPACDGRSDRRSDGRNLS